MSSDLEKLAYQILAAENQKASSPKPLIPTYTGGAPFIIKKPKVKKKGLDYVDILFWGFSIIMILAVAANAKYGG